MSKRLTDGWPLAAAWQNLLRFYRTCGGLRFSHARRYSVIERLDACTQWCDWQDLGGEG